MSTRRIPCAIAPGADDSRPKDGVDSLAYARPAAALVLGGLLLLIRP